MMTQLLMVIVLFFCAFHIFTADAQKQCSNFYFSRHLDMKLLCGIFETLLAVNHIECQKKCAAKLSCFSINFYHNGTDVCELIKGARNTFPDCLVWRKGSEHNKLTSSGSCSSSVSCETRQIKKALPGNWYQLDSSAFKLFEQKQNHTAASAVCSAEGGALATINSENENNFVAEMYLKEKQSKRALLIKQTLKPFKHWKLDGSDQDVTLLGNLAAKKDEHNISAALHFTGTAGSYATTPAWDINVMTFSISIWFKLDDISLYHYYSYWSSPYLFYMGVFPQNTGASVIFQARQKVNPSPDLFAIQGRQVVVNQWTHVAVVWNRATKQATLYQDGSKVSQSIPLTTSELDLPAPTRSVFDVGYRLVTGAAMKGWLRSFEMQLLWIQEHGLELNKATLIKPQSLSQTPIAFPREPGGRINGKKYIVVGTWSLSVKDWFNRSQE